MDGRRIGTYGAVLASLVLLGMLVTGGPLIGGRPAPAAPVLPAHPAPRPTTRIRDRQRDASLRIAIRGSGTVIVTAGARCRRHCVVRVRLGARMRLTARPGDQARFAGWTGAPSCRTGRSCTVTVRADASVGARFVPRPPPQVRLTVRRAGTASGILAIDGADGGCAAGCEFPAGTSVTMRAAYDQRATTIGWQGTTCSGHICRVRLERDTTVTASFAPRQYALTVRSRGPGRVAECSGRRSCTLSYRYGQTATLVATPGSRGVLAGWDDCEHSRANRCTVRMTRARAVTASFAGAPTVRLQVQTAGRGSVTLGARGACAAGCDVRRGVTVVLHAHYDPQTQGVIWSVPGCRGATCRIVMRHDATVRVRFGRLEMTMEGPGSLHGDPPPDHHGAVLTRRRRPASERVR
jgi:hypothetical protein